MNMKVQALGSYEINYDTFIFRVVFFCVLASPFMHDEVIPFLQIWYAEAEDWPDGFSFHRTDICFPRSEISTAMHPVGYLGELNWSLMLCSILHGAMPTSLGINTNMSANAMRHSCLSTTASLLLSLHCLPSSESRK